MVSFERTNLLLIPLPVQGGIDAVLTRIPGAVNAVNVNLLAGELSTLSEFPVASILPLFCPPLSHEVLPIFLSVLFLASIPFFVAMMTLILVYCQWGHCDFLFSFLQMTCLS